MFPKFYLLETPKDPQRSSFNPALGEVPLVDDPSPLADLKIQSTERSLVAIHDSPNSADSVRHGRGHGVHALLHDLARRWRLVTPRTPPQTLPVPPWRARAPT